MSPVAHNDYSERKKMTGNENRKGQSAVEARGREATDRETRSASAALRGASASSAARSGGLPQPTWDQLPQRCRAGRRGS